MRGDLAVRFSFSHRFSPSPQSERLEQAKYNSETQEKMRVARVQHCGA